MSMQILTGAIDQWRSDVPLADASLKNPNASLPLLQGEWLTQSSSGWGRITASAANDVKATDGQKAVPVFSQRGDAAVQAIAKIAVIRSGPSYRAEIDLYKQLGLTTSSYAIDTELTVAAIDSDSADPNAGRTILLPAASGDPVYATVDTPPSAMGEDMVVNVLPSPYTKA